jgi:hypothetical protein
MFSQKVSWFLSNMDTGEQIEGQFPPEDLTQEMGGTFAEESPLNRQHPIAQFLHGNSETVSFTGRLFAETSIDSLTKPLRMLQNWTKRDPNLFRPPTLLFWVGDATVNLAECILERPLSIKYRSFRNNGSPRDISFTVNLREYVPYSLLVESGGETRYHQARDRDYYEWLCQREYSDPMLGVVIRDRHPDHGLLAAGDIAKLPSAETLRKAKPQTTSIALKTAYGRKDTPQRNLRVGVFDRLNRIHTSHVVLG